MTEDKKVEVIENECDDLLHDLIGKKVLIRDDKAGVFITTLTKIRSKEWVGSESRKIYYWEKAGAVEGIAQTGIDLENSLLTVKTPMAAGKNLVQICIVEDEIFDELMGADVWNPKD